MTEAHKYRAIAAELRAEIRSGILPVGSPMPSRAKVAERFGVSHVTARHAGSILEAEGLVRVEQGRRTLVISQGDGHPADDDDYELHKKLVVAIDTLTEVAQALARRSQRNVPR